MIGTLFGLVRAVPKTTWRWIAAGALVAGVAWWLVDTGRDAERARWEAAQAREALATAQEELRIVRALAAAADEAVRAAARQQHQTTIIRERILQVMDPAACLDQPFPVEALDALRD